MEGWAGGVNCHLAGVSLSQGVLRLPCHGLSRVPPSGFLGPTSGTDCSGFPIYLCLEKGSLGWGREMFEKERVKRSLSLMVMKFAAWAVWEWGRW